MLNRCQIILTLFSDFTMDIIFENDSVMVT